jgi:hypothetical protein
MGMHWLPLDNAAKIFPSTISKRNTIVFRFTAVLKERISLEYLNTAAEKTIRRYPYFNVQLRKGFFWYTLEFIDKIPVINADSKYPCSYIPVKRRGVVPYRIRVFGKRLSVEFAHFLTDGTGALSFLRTLLCQYFTEQGVSISDWGEIPNPAENPDPEEFEDGYLKGYVKNIPHPRVPDKAFHLPGPFRKKGEYGVVSGFLNTAEVLNKAKEYNASLTEFLTALLIDSHLRIQHDLVKKKQLGRLRPIRVTVPVNVRPYLKTKAMRNVFLSVLPEIDPRLGDYSFEDILSIVHHSLRLLVNEHYIRMQIARNVEGEMSLVNRLFPVFLKDLVLKPIYNKTGQQPATCSLSNLGQVKLPKEIASRCDRFIFIPPPGVISKQDCSVISFGSTLTISFGKLIEDNALEREFFRLLRKMGLHIKIEHN